jgi:Skp family chaperone for outer membrane proteins
MSKFQVFLCFVIVAASSAILRNAPFRMPLPLQAAEVVPPVTSPHRGGIGLLDVSKVFKNCKSFETQMAQLKKRGEDIGKEIGLRTALTQQLAENLKALTPGSDAYNTLQREVVAQQADLQLFQGRRHPELQSEETKVYAETYERLEKEVAKVAATNHLRLVLKFSSGAIDKDKRDTVLAGVNRPIVYHDGLDITDAVIAAMAAE